MPGNFNIEEFEKEYQLTVALTEVIGLLNQLSEEVDDTLMAVGSESMASSLLVYDFVKAAAKHSPGLKSVADQLGERFKSISNRRAKTDRSTVYYLSLMGLIKQTPVQSIPELLPTFLEPVSTLLKTLPTLSKILPIFLEALSILPKTLQGASETLPTLLETLPRRLEPDRAYFNPVKTN